jgi:Protein of unknown function (DUF3224)
VPHAVAKFTNESYEQEPYDEGEGTALERVHITRSFEGDLEGSATAELLTAQTESGSAAYVALDRIKGRLGDREGAFVLQHYGTISPDGSEIAGAVVPGSGTGGLDGLRGEGTIAVDEDGNHRLTLDYEIGG